MAVKEVITTVNVEARRTLGIMPGDTVRVMQKINEKGKTRLQAFEGLVLTVKHGTEPGATFTVRKVSSGVGIEKTFPLFSPMIDKIEIIKRTKVRRAKLYYIRDKAAKEIRRSMRNAFLVGQSIESDIAEKERLVRETQEAEEAEKARLEAEEVKRAEEAKVAEEKETAAQEQEVPAGDTSEAEAPTDAPAEAPAEPSTEVEKAA